MSVNIAIGQIVHKTNTFSPLKTTKEDFMASEWCFHESIIANHEGIKDYLGGMITSGKELKVNLHPTFSALARSSGIIQQATYEQMKDHLLTALEDIEGLDGICLHLHGAGIAEEVEDLEGDLLESVRECIGKDIPLVVILDLHAHVTTKMAKSADLLLSVKNYPHTDAYELGRKALLFTYEMIQKQIKPHMAIHKLPLLLPLSTSLLAPVKEINHFCRSFEKHPQVLSCSLVHGFPFSDTKENSAAVIVITDDALALAEVIASHVAKFIMDRKDAFFKPLQSPVDGVKRALTLKNGPIILNETSDNPNAGGAGDATYLLRALLKTEDIKACFGTIYDEKAMEKILKHQVGETISLSLGGKIARFYDEPLEVEAYIQSVTDGKSMQTSPLQKGMMIDLGRSARLVIQGIDVIVCSKRVEVIDDTVFKLHGIDVSDYFLVGLKSSDDFRAFYQAIAKKIIPVNAPGLTHADLRTFPFAKVSESVYPLSMEN